MVSSINLPHTERHFQTAVFTSFMGVSRLFSGACRGDPLVRIAESIEAESDGTIDEKERLN
jgi:hypothetical protein